ncbi:DnaA N-terminal domain-containing protein [Loktanella sp. DSM 29012]|uniref:DnaA N-terminal domain-containing protein n=1 Tax=Loktanella sp. DSM 29012 TaxID=1881056 RepID=UPI0008B6197E|nr:DnaA N-terminal domain-containing protein [Loktanella sp. DSM 29012]SEQ83365.1 DnaA N-terminal domain-containing protein [Loktanella sp. DSM 29012]
MQTKHAAGPGAGAVKYDILTALLVMAAQGDPVEGRLALRLSLLITARYNWRMGRFSTGQREIARLWGVTERTAKRELAQMRTRGWIRVTQPAARGRVATHAIDLDRIIRDSMPLWPQVGPDFEERMTGAPAPVAPLPDNKIVPLHPARAAETGVWAGAQALLMAQDGALYRAWFASLIGTDDGAGGLTLTAPTRFIADYVREHYMPRLYAAVRQSDAAIVQITIDSSPA